MKGRHNPLIVGSVALAVSVALASCDSNANGGSSSIATATNGSNSGGGTAPTVTPTPTADPATVETKDRLDVEQAWRKFEVTSLTMASLPAEQAEQAFQLVAVEPQLTRLREGYAKLKAQNWAGYGQVISKITWQEPIAGKDTAVVHDCQDGSQSGILDVKSGNKLTVGTANTPSTGTVKRTTHGWRVSDSQVDQVNKCTPGE